MQEEGAVASSWQNKNEIIFIHNECENKNKIHNDGVDDDEKKNTKKLTGKCLAGIIRGDFV